MVMKSPVDVNNTVSFSILLKSTSDRYRPDRIPVGPITVRYRFKHNANWGNFHARLHSAFLVYTHLSFQMKTLKNEPTCVFACICDFIGAFGNTFCFIKRRGRRL